jgi:hypothetical protein
MDKITLNIFPEFGYEMACSMPYAYWLHKQNKLEKVITCKDMAPFYYFCNNVEESHTKRSVNNQINGVQNLPNKWIHHNAEAIFGKDYSKLTEEQKIEANGVLDYSQWISPPLKEFYKKQSKDEYKLDKDTIVISNKISMDHGQEPHAYFDIPTLYEIFNYLTEKGYAIIYKRPKMSEFTIDENEMLTKSNQYTISANVEGIGVIDDHNLTKYYDDVYILDDLISNEESYNVGQLRWFSNVDKFITISGGNSIFCSYFGGTQITYVTTSKELRHGYYNGESYTKKLGNAKIYPILDPESEIIKRGYNDYSHLLNKIKEIF